MTAFPSYTRAPWKAAQLHPGGDAFTTGLRYPLPYVRVAFFLRTLKGVTRLLREVSTLTSLPSSVSVCQPRSLPGAHVCRSGGGRRQDSEGPRAYFWGACSLSEPPPSSPSASPCSSASLAASVAAIQGGSCSLGSVSHCCGLSSDPKQSPGAHGELPSGICFSSGLEPGLLTVQYLKTAALCVLSSLVILYREEISHNQRSRPIES